MAIYKCPECGKEVERESKEAQIKSYCEETGKNAQLRKVRT